MVWRLQLQNPKSDALSNTNCLNHSDRMLWNFCSNKWICLLDFKSLIAILQWVDIATSKAKVLPKVGRRNFSTSVDALLEMMYPSQRSPLNWWYIYSKQTLLINLNWRGLDARPGRRTQEPPTTGRKNSTIGHCVVLMLAFETWCRTNQIKQVAKVCGHDLRVSKLAWWHSASRLPKKGPSPDARMIRMHGPPRTWRWCLRIGCHVRVQNWTEWQDTLNKETQKVSTNLMRLRATKGCSTQPRSSRRICGLEAFRKWLVLRACLIWRAISKLYGNGYYALWQLCSTTNGLLQPRMSHGMTFRPKHQRNGEQKSLKHPLFEVSGATAHSTCLDGMHVLDSGFTVIVRETSPLTLSSIYDPETGSKT